jgi:hypothetical protein
MSLARIEQAQTLFNHITHCPDHRRQDFVGRDLSGMSLQRVQKAAAPREAQFCIDMDDSQTRLDRLLKVLVVGSRPAVQSEDPSCSLISAIL